MKRCNETTSRKFCSQSTFTFFDTTASTISQSWYSFSEKKWIRWKLLHRFRGMICNYPLNAWKCYHVDRKITFIRLLLCDLDLIKSYIIILMWTPYIVMSKLLRIPLLGVILVCYLLIYFRRSENTDWSVSEKLTSLCGQTVHEVVVILVQLLPI